MECIRCYCPNEPHRRFCSQCGQALVSICPRCGFFNRVTDRFCGGCGDALQAQSSEKVPFYPRDIPELPVHYPLPKITPPSPTPSSVPKHTASMPASFVANPSAKTEAPTNQDVEISEDDLQELLSPPAIVSTNLPSKVSQDDIDKLFGG